MRTNEEAPLKAQVKQSSGTCPSATSQPCGKGKAIARAMVMLMLASAISAYVVIERRRNDAEAKETERQRLESIASDRNDQTADTKRAGKQRLKDEGKRGALLADPAEQAKILQVKIPLTAATAKGGYRYTGFTVGALDGKGRKINQQEAASGFEVQRGSRWKVILTGDLYGEKNQDLATVILPFPADLNLKNITILLPPALAEIQVVNPYDSADYTRIKISGPAGSNHNVGANLTTANCSLKPSDLTPEPALLTPRPQPFPEKNKPLHIPVAGNGQWILTCTGCVFGDKPLPSVPATTKASSTRIDTPLPLSGTYTLAAPMTRFPDGPRNPNLATTKDDPVKVGNNYEVDYFNRMVYLSLDDDKSAQPFRRAFKKILPDVGLPHYLCAFLQLDLRTGKNGKMTVLLTYPHVGFIQYPGDLSPEKNPNGSIKLPNPDGSFNLTSTIAEMFAGNFEHEGIATWAAEYDKTIHSRNPAKLKQFMQASLADWVAYQTDRLQKKPLLNFSRWDYVEDINSFRFEVTPRNGTLCLNKVVQIYPNWQLYYKKDLFPAGSVYLKEPVDMTRVPLGGNHP